MNELEQKIIELTQTGLPICESPYQAIASELGISQQALFVALDKMKQKKMIRRIGAVPNHFALGYTFNLMTVWDVDDAHIDEVGAMVGQLDFVSHCYRRPRHLPDWPYNLFAMVHGKSEEEAKQKMAEVENLVKAHCRQFTALKSTKILKKTGLRI